MRVIPFLLFSLIASPAIAAPLPAPLTPAGEGQVQCYVPNLAARTCQLVATYVVDKAGAIQNIATVVISREPLITMTTTAAVQVRDGRVCGVVHPEDFAGAQFTIAGQPADLRQTADLRLHVADGMKTIIGHEICTAFVRTGQAWVAKAFLDGAAQPDGDELFDWVPANAGWKVAP